MQVSSESAGAGDSVRVWVEDGLVDVISEDRALVRLTGAASVNAEDRVAVRISFDPNSPTLGVAARVLSIRPEDGAWECELEWTHAGPERARLGSLIAALA